MSSYEKIKRKIFTLPELLPAIHDWKKAGQKLVFTNGCFDLLHLGHVHYLSQAADQGDRLIIGVNSDASVKKLKGEGRPIQDEMARMMILSALSLTDAIVKFEEDTPFQLIQQITPDVLVKGGDYEPASVVGHDHVTANGGKVECLPFLEGYSTSLMEGRIKSNDK